MTKTRRGMSQVRFELTADSPARALAIWDEIVSFAKSMDVEFAARPLTGDNKPEASWQTTTMPKHELSAYVARAKEKDGGKDMAYYPINEENWLPEGEDFPDFSPELNWTAEAGVRSVTRAASVVVRAGSQNIYCFGATPSYAVTRAASARTHLYAGAATTRTQLVAAFDGLSTIVGPSAQNYTNSAVQLDLSVQHAAESIACLHGHAVLRTVGVSARKRTSSMTPALGRAMAMLLAQPLSKELRDAPKRPALFVTAQRTIAAIVAATGDKEVVLWANC